MRILSTQFIKAKLKRLLLQQQNTNQKNMMTPILAEQVNQIVQKQTLALEKKRSKTITSNVHYKQVMSCSKGKMVSLIWKRIT